MKDTRIQLALNEYNHVPEFALFFPEPDDPRSLFFYRMVNGRYNEVQLSPGAQVEIGGVPGLVLQVKPKDDWRKGDKIAYFYRGEARLPVAGERERALAERRRAEEAQQRADEANERAHEAHQRADEADQRAHEANQRAEAAAQRADEDRAYAEKLRARLESLGIDPGDSPR